jgi:hypothetical protein
MAKSARTYVRDGNGRFAGGGGGGGGGGKRPKAKAMAKGANRLVRDNSGKITGASEGATAREGRFRTAGGKLRATQTAKISGGAGIRANTIAKGGGGVRGSVARGLAATRKARMTAAKPAAAKPMAKSAPEQSAPAKAAKKRKPQMGGSSVAAGRKAKDKYQMKRANQRFKKTSLPADYAPKWTRKRTKV